MESVPDADRWVQNCGRENRENITVQRAAWLGLRGEAWRMMQNIRGADGRSAVIKASP